MRIIGFNFTKVSAEKLKDFKLSSDRNTNIEFISIEKEETTLAKEDSEVLKASFKFSVIYHNKENKEAKGAEVVLSGFILLMASKSESKDLQSSWTKKELSDSFRVPIFNFILRKCSIRAMQLEEELNLPLHLPLPQLRIGNSEEKNKG